MTETQFLFRADVRKMNSPFPRYVPTLFLSVLFCGLSPVVLAQNASIVGQIVDADTGDPLPGVNVFLDQTTFGAASSEDGTYAIPAIQRGSYRVVASIVGYGTESTLIEVVPEKRQYAVNFRLRRVVIELGEVEVEDRRSRGWERNLRQFERGFLGSSRNAQRTNILNPYVLDFEQNQGRFEARASAPIVVENRALGYRLTIHLTYYFDMGAAITMGGPVYFDELEPVDTDEAELWRANRRETYSGSLMHLLRSLIDGNSRQEGFYVAHEIAPGAYNYSERRRIDLGLIPFIDAGGRPYLYRLFFEHPLYVEYGRETSWLRLTGNDATLHEDGYLYTFDFEPPPMSVRGALSNRRVADMLPRDYR